MTQTPEFSSKHQQMIVAQRLELLDLTSQAQPVDLTLSHAERLSARRSQPVVGCSKEKLGTVQCNAEITLTLEIVDGRADKSAVSRGSLDFLDFHIT